MQEKVRRDPKDIFLDNFRLRLYKGLDYLVLFLYALVIALGAFVADYVLAMVLSWLLEPTVSKYTEVATLFDWFQIGSASLTLVVAFAIAFFSALSQVQFAYETSKEPPFERKQNA